MFSCHAAHFLVFQGSRSQAFRLMEEKPSEKLLTPDKTLQEGAKNSDP